MNKSDIKRKLAACGLAACLVAGAGSVLTSCGKNDDDNKRTYIVIINDNNAIIYKTNSDIFKGTAYLYDLDINTSNYIKFSNKSIEEGEEQVKALIGEDGNISYCEKDDTLKLKKIK